MSAIRRDYMPPCGINTQDFAGLCGRGSSILAELYSMPDYVTTVTGIPIRLSGGYWARHQLHAGIRYILVASKLRISLASVVGEHR